MTANPPKYPQVEVTLDLDGPGGNAFVILGVCGAAAKKAGLSKEQIDEFMIEAKSSNYKHLIQTCHAYFSITEV